MFSSTSNGFEHVQLILDLKLKLGLPLFTTTYAEATLRGPQAQQQPVNIIFCTTHLAQAFHSL